MHPLKLRMDFFLLGIETLSEFQIRSANAPIYWGYPFLYFTSGFVSPESSFASANIGVEFVEKKMKWICLSSSITTRRLFHLYEYSEIWIRHFYFFFYNQLFFTSLTWNYWNMILNLHLFMNSRNIQTDEPALFLFRGEKKGKKICVKTFNFFLCIVLRKYLSNLVTFFFLNL